MDVQNIKFSSFTPTGQHCGKGKFFTHKELSKESSRQRRLRTLEGSGILYHKDIPFRAVKNRSAAQIMHGYFQPDKNQQNIAERKRKLKDILSLLETRNNDAKLM